MNTISAFLKIVHGFFFHKLVIYTLTVQKIQMANFKVLYPFQNMMSKLANFRVIKKPENWSFSKDSCKTRKTSKTFLESLLVTASSIYYAYLKSTQLKIIYYGQRCIKKIHLIPAEIGKNDPKQEMINNLKTRLRKSFKKFRKLCLHIMYLHTKFEGNRSRWMYSPPNGIYWQPFLIVFELYI